MYIPESFKTKDKEELIEFISEWSFGDLITTANGRINISYIPFVFDQDEMLLYGHLASQDYQRLKQHNIDDLVVIFKEPSWDASPPNMHQPKWSFQTVHIKGRPEFINKIQLLTLVDGLTQRNDKQLSAFSSGKKLIFTREETESMLNEIIGIRIHIEEIVGKYKRSHANMEDTGDTYSLQLGSR